MPQIKVEPLASQLNLKAALQVVLTKMLIRILVLGSKAQTSTIGLKKGEMRSQRKGTIDQLMVHLKSRESNTIKLLICVVLNLLF